MPVAQEAKAEQIRQLDFSALAGVANNEGGGTAFGRGEIIRPAPLKHKRRKQSLSSGEIQQATLEELFAVPVSTESAQEAKRPARQKGTHHDSITQSNFEALAGVSTETV